MIESNVKNLTDNEIAQMLSTLMNEQRERKTEKEKKAWEKVQKAIEEYTQEFGSIAVRDYSSTIYVDPTCDFSSWGDITATQGW